MLCIHFTDDPGDIGGEPYDVGADLAVPRPGLVHVVVPQMPAEHSGRGSNEGAGEQESDRNERERFLNDTLFKDSAMAPSGQKYMAVSKSGRCQTSR